MLVGGGVAMAWTSRAGAAGFGWFAYTPLSGDADWHMSWGDSPSNRSLVIVTRWQLAGYAAAAAGLAVLTAGIGFHLGRRRAHLPGEP